jgi:hypothetical protein
MQNLNISSIHYYVKKNTKDTKFHKYSQKQIDGYYHVISDFLFRVSCTTFSYELRIGKFVILPFLKKDIFCYNIISKRHVYYLIDKYHGKIESFDMVHTDNTISTYSSYIVFDTEFQAKRFIVDIQAYINKKCKKPYMKYLGL